MSELEYFLSLKNIEISVYAQAEQSLLLLTQGNIYNRLRFLNKYLMFLYIIRGIKRAIWRKLVKISDCRVTSFLKELPGCRVSRHVVPNDTITFKIKFTADRIIDHSCRGADRK